MLKLIKQKFKEKNMEHRYKSHLYVYLIICGVLYIVYSSLKGNADASVLQGWVKGTYFFLSLMTMVVAYFDIAKKGDKYIKTHHPDLYDRYYNVLVTGKKEIKRPIFIGLQTMTNTDYQNDVNLKTIRKEAKLYICALAIIFILTITQVI